MAALGAAQTIAVTGTAATLTAASAGGDTFVANDRGLVVVQNLDASSTTVTVVTTKTHRGLVIPNRTVAVAAGAITFVPISVGDNANNDGLVSLTYSKVTGPLKVGYIER